jgi:GLPGLI family protein
MNIPKKTFQNNVGFYFSMILLQVSFLAFSQKPTISEVIYKTKSLINLEETRKKNPDATDLHVRIMNEMENIQFSLLFNKTESLFEEKESMVSDEKKDSYLQALGRSMTFNGKLYTNIKSGLVLHQKTLTSDVFLIESNVKDIKWQLTSETKKIDNYTCYKATTFTTIESVRGTVELPVTVWYAPNIPFAFGPKNYAGLPGLILEVEVNKLVFYAVKIDLNKPMKDSGIVAPAKGKRVTIKEFLEIEKKGFSQYQRN